ncbi:PDZ domain-containing protein [Synechococcus sp. M16CYN]
MEWEPQWHRQILQFPVWTPGSYTVRDHVQHLHSLTLHSLGTPLSIRRLAPHKWQCDLVDLDPLTLTYAVESRDLSVRTGLIDPDLASLALASVVLEVEGFRWLPHRLQVVVPNSWQVHIPLTRLEQGWYAEDLDELIDSPLHAGLFGFQSFTVQGYRHELLLIGSHPFGWPETFVVDLERVCKATCQLMGTAPPAGDRYHLVLQLLENGYGGLEHDYSAVLQYSWSALATDKGYRKLLQLVGHEYLHQWNVRRLRPTEYRPYDYTRPVVSEGLWFAEGITSYYDLSLPLLAGCSDRSMLLSDLGEELSAVLMTSGRSIQSLSMSAEEAWVKLYKSTPASRDSQVSYYRLGTAVAFCLDVRLRTHGSSLAQLLRYLWERYGRTLRGYCRQDLHCWLASLADGISADLDHWLDDTDSVPLEQTAQSIGLRLVPVPSKMPHHGLTLKESSGALVIQRVMQQSPGMKASLVVGDEILGLNGFRVQHLDTIPLLMRNQKDVLVTFARRGSIQETYLSPETGVERWCLDWDSGATSDQLALREQWFQIL